MDKVTMEDIAERADVSMTTVSRALNNKPDIDDQTKRKILSVADELNYRPNRFAKGLRSSNTSTLGVIVTDISNPFFSAVLKGVEAAAGKQDYSLIFEDTDESYDMEQSAIQTMLNEQLDGLLITPIQTNGKTILDLKQTNLPFVLLGRYFEDLETNYVATNDVKGAYQATEHLIERGNEKIAFLNGPNYISSSKERLEGYQKAMKAHDLPVPDSFIADKSVTTMSGGYEAAKELISRSPRPTAIFCFSDFVALGAVKAAREAGLKIPQNLSVVGYDDICFSTCLEVPLTTVRIPKRELGAKAANALMDIVAGNESEDSFTQLRLEPELIIRESS